MPIYSYLLRLGFRLLYNELAFTYDWVSHLTSMGQWREWQRTALARLPKGRILEVAHGTGDTLIDLLAAGCQPVGIDLSPYMGRIARRKLRQQGLSAPLVRGRAQALPFAPGAFPAIAATFPTEFIVAADSLAEFHRVLAPGGRLVFIPTAIFTSPLPLDRLADWLFKITGQRGPWPPNVEATFRSAGFAVRVETEALPRSRVTVVIAEKKSK